MKKIGSNILNIEEVSQNVINIEVYIKIYIQELAKNILKYMKSKSIFLIIEKVIKILYY